MDADPESPAETSAEKALPPESETPIPLHFRVPENMPSKYAHHMAVIPGDGEVSLMFFEVIPPFLAGTPEGKKKLLEEGLKAICVARIAVPVHRFPEFINAMQTTHEKLLRAAGDLAEAEAKDVEAEPES